MVLKDTLRLTRVIYASILIDRQAGWQLSFKGNTLIGDEFASGNRLHAGTII